MGAMSSASMVTAAMVMSWCNCNCRSFSNRVNKSFGDDDWIWEESCTSANTSPGSSYSAFTS